jgi:puromycin-sensitive aminopeptidase
MCKFRTGGSEAVESNPYRLPRTVLPESYQLRLVPDLANATYSGEVTIKVKVLEPVSEIVLNAITFEDAKERKTPVIQISEALIRRGNGTAFIGSVEAEPETERVRIKVNGVVGTGEWQLKLRFTGTLNDKLKGFYRSVYQDAAGNDKVIATTQFESTDARRAFPCFDEPDMKATYQLTIVIDPTLKAVSNARVVSITHDEQGRKVVEFAPTMKMSTYIVAFVVGDLVCTKPVMVDGIQVRVWCTPGKENLTRFALEAAQFALRYYRKYFGVPYPGDKLDMLAIPDFAAGAMENLGCVTYRETALLVDPAVASQSAIDRVAEVVAHELAHMWFGDLVTMKWWNGLWLNEAFATFMAAKCVDAWKREWATWEKFGLARGAAYETDSLGATRPIEFTVVSPEDAEGMFDVLTYEKGCSVLRMLEQYIGEETFRKGIAQYIKSFAYGNTEGSDLWAALGTAAGLPVSEIMHGWIFTPGFPVVSVSRSDKAGALTLKQQPFKFLDEKVDRDQLWQVPVLLRAKTDEGVVTIKHLLSEREETIYVGENLEWVVANAGGHGFYRVLYSDDLSARLVTDAQSMLSVIERANLVADAWACVQAGLSNSLAYLELVKQLSDEDDPNVWATIEKGLESLHGLLPEGSQERARYEAMVRDLVAPALARVGWQPQDGETLQASELRSVLIGTLAIIGNDEAAHARAAEIFAAWKADRNSVEGNVIDAVVEVLATVGGAELFDEFYALFKSAQSPEEEDRFREALSLFNDHDLHTRLLNACIDPSEIRTQDAPYLIARLLGKEGAAGVCAWQFVKDNWAQLTKLYPNSGVVRMAEGADALNTPELEADVKAFFATHKVKGAGKAIDQMLEKLRVAVLLRERELPVLTAAFGQAA